MSMSKIALAIPLVLGIACSTSRTQSKDHTGAMWTEHDGGSTQADAQPQGSGQAADAAASSTGTGSASADSSGAAGTDGGAIALTAGGSSDTGATGSGSSSESTGAANPSGSPGSEQGSSAAGSSDQGSMGSAGAAGAPAGEMVKGKVTKVSSSEISITPKGGSATTLKIGDDTHVMINGKEAKHTQLKAGQWVQATYGTEGGEMVATKIVVSSSKQGHKGGSSTHHGTGSSGSGSSGSSGAPGTGGSSGSSGGTQQ